MQSVCRSKKSLTEQSVTIDIGAINRSLLPSKCELTTILGSPNRNNENGLILGYGYQLKNNDSIDTVAAMDIIFDRSGEMIHRIKLKYLRYNLDADFEKGVAVLKVDIFIDKET